MQSEYAIPPVALQASAVSATVAPMTPDVPTMRDDPDEVERWRAWSARGANTDREMARTMNRVFAALILALSMWLVFQLLV